MSNYVNLNEVGNLTQSGKNYAGTSEEGIGNARNHQAKMEGAQSGWKGQGGSTLQRSSMAAVANSGQLAKQIADQALRSVLGEKAAVTGDEESNQDQQAGLTGNENLSGFVGRPINV